jgi:xanthine dehydrogenase accessory factor
VGGELALVFPDHVVGTLGDPALDTHANDELHELLKRGGTKLLPVAESRLFLEAYVPQPHLVIVGAVHIAIPLVTFGQTLGFKTTVIDARGQFITAERFPHVDRMIEAWPDEALAQIPLHPGVAAVCLAHDPKFEDPAMEVLLRSDAGYIGAVGSRNTSLERRERLKAAGFSDADLDRIHGPVGINIGAKTPEEIALSIMAEIVAVRRGRDPRTALAPAKSAAPAS